MRAGTSLAIVLGAAAITVFTANCSVSGEEGVSEVDAATETATNRDDGVDEPDSGADAEEIAADAAPALRCSVPPTIPTKSCAGGWCRIEPGCFVMGAPRDEFGVARYDDRQVVVTLTRPFLIQELELTQRAWAAAGLPNPAGVEEHLRDCVDPACPVGNITFYDAVAYANHLSRTASPPLPECYALEGCASEPGKQGIFSTDLQTSNSPFSRSSRTRKRKLLAATPSTTRWS